MKQEIRKLKFLLTLSLAGLLFSCQVEEEVANDNNLQQNNFKIEKKKFNELMKEQQFNTAFSKIPKQKLKANVASKTVMENQYGFNITDAPAVVFSAGNRLTSYTFHITRDISLPVNQFENLIVQVDSTGTTTANTIKYFLNAQPIYNTTDKEYSFNINHTVLTPIVYNATTHVEGKVMYTGGDGCTIITLMCDYGVDHPAGTECLANAANRNFYLSSDSSGCQSGPSGSDGGPTGGTATGSTSGTAVGGGSGGTGGTYTGPNLPSLNDTDVPKDPCEELKRKVQKPIIRTEINRLRSLVGASTENGAQFYVNPDGTFGITPASEVGTQFVKFPINTNSNFLTIHTHQKGSDANPSFNYPMLNWGDLRKLSEYSINYIPNSSGVDPQICVMVSVPGQLFAVTINNPKSFRRFAAAFNNVAVIEKYNEALRLLFEATLGSNEQPKDANTDKLAKIFLSEINNVANETGRPNFDLSLYQIENDNATLDTAKWNKISLDSTQPNGVKKTPCN